MEYWRFIREVRNLDFIPDEQAADAAVKASLGSLVSNTEEPQARRFMENLPDPLTESKLYGQQRFSNVSSDEFFEELANQFGISTDQARKLAEKTVCLSKEAVGDDALTDVEVHLSERWRSFIHEV